MRDSFTEAQLRCSAGTPICRGEMGQPLRIPYSVPPPPNLGFHSVFCGGALPARTTSSSRVRPGCGQGMVDWTDWPHRPGPAASWPVLRRREFRGPVSTGRPVVPPRPLVHPDPALPGASGRPVVPHSRFPVRPSARPFARPFVYPSQVWAEALFSPRDRAIALQPTPTWVFGDSNPPQKPAAGCSPCCTCAHLETQPLHRWRRWRWGYPSSDTLLPFGPPATAEWSSVDLPTWRGRLWLAGLVPCGRSIPLE